MPKEFDYDEHRTMLLERCWREVLREIVEGDCPEYVAIRKTGDAAAKLEAQRQLLIAMVERLQDWIHPSETQITVFLLKTLDFEIPPDDHDYWKALGL